MLFSLEFHEHDDDDEPLAPHGYEVKRDFHKISTVILAIVL
jgi:hypothetical protein